MNVLVFFSVSSFCGLILRVFRDRRGRGLQLKLYLSAWLFGVYSVWHTGATWY